MKCYRECLRVEIFVYNLAAERFRDFIVCIICLTKKKDWSKYEDVSFIKVEIKTRIFELHHVCLNQLELEQ